MFHVNILLIMIKEIKTEKFEGLAVLVPDGAHGYFYSVDSKGKYLTSNSGTFDNDGDDEGFEIKISDDSRRTFKILGKATELTEEQLKLIIPDTFRRRRFSHFQDILEAQGCYSVNPYAGIFRPHLSTPEKGNLGEIIAGVIYNDVKQLFLEAEANTGTWLILQKL